MNWVSCFVLFFWQGPVSDPGPSLETWLLGHLYLFGTSWPSQAASPRGLDHRQVVIAHLCVLGCLWSWGSPVRHLQPDLAMRAEGCRGTLELDSQGTSDALWHSSSTWLVQARKPSLGR